MHRSHQQKRPFVTLKWARTQDGVMGVKGERLIISNTYTQMLCHKRRTEHQAILVGRKTLEEDAPTLNVRAWIGKNPQPIVLGSHVKNLPQGWWSFPTVEDLLSALYEKGVQTLLVEGGRTTLQAFIDKGMWDEAFVEWGDFSWAENPEGKTRETVKVPVWRDAERIADERVMGRHIEHWKHLSTTE